MKEKVSRPNCQPTRFSIDVAASSFLAFFFSFFLVAAQTSDLATIEFQPGEQTAHATSIQGPHFAAHHNAQPHLPLGAVPIPPESESKSEKEADGVDDEAVKLFASLSLNERSDLSTRKCLLLQLLNARQNRKEVSLFILHHSWKSFLV